MDPTVPPVEPTIRLERPELQPATKVRLTHAGAVRLDARAPQPRQARILLVEDDPLVLRALTRILSNAGYEVIAHTDPRKALDETDFGVVISDFMMPEVDGVELLAQIKLRHPSAVRLMITVASDFKVGLKAVNRGEVYRLIPKPWNMKELTLIVDQAMEHHRMTVASRRLTTALKQRAEHLEAAATARANDLLEGMVRALDYRDTDTQWHSRRVSLFATLLAQKAGIQGAALRDIGQGALLHDIGKIGVRDAILSKPGPLTPEEWVEMKRHPEIGMRILSGIPHLSQATQIVYQHHERWDGTGYPRGLAREEIVVGARIFSIVDALDAITSDRPYRKAMPLGFAKSQIAAVARTQLDPELVQAFLEVPDARWADIRHEVDQLEGRSRVGLSCVGPAEAAQ